MITKKAIFLDLDGTLLNDKKGVTTANKNAIKKALSHGHQVVISTGRPLVSVKYLAKELGLTAKNCFAIAYNGGEVYDLYHQKTIYKKTIPIKYVLYIFEQAAKYGLHCQTYNDEHIITNRDTIALRKYIEGTNIQATIVDDIAAALTQEPVKMIVIDFENQETLIRFRKETAAWTNGKMEQIFSCSAYLEHIAPEISKGKAIRFLCDYLNIPLEHTIAVGDAENDISMIEAAAIGVAMANATDEVKATSSYVTKRDNNNSGVAEVIEKFLLN